MQRTVVCQCGPCPHCRAPSDNSLRLPPGEFTLLWHECGECAGRWGHILPDHDEADGHFDADTWERTRPPEVIVG